jgi:hypothetical protein
VVSVGTLAFLLLQIDLRHAMGHVDARVAWVLIPSLLLYVGLSLWIEAVSLVRLLPRSSAPLTSWTCAKLKAASYPLGLLHYALGAGGLALLLRRRGALRVTDAVGIVMLISLFDLGLLLALTALGAGLLSTREPAVQASFGVAAVVGIALGFTFLRTSASFRSLDRVRNLEFFRALREASPRSLVELGVLRLLFLLCFITLGAAALEAFGVSVTLGDLIVNLAGVALVSVLPIAVAGLGTGQVAFVYLFRGWADPSTLLACSLTLSAGLIALRAAIGLVFARELTREALVAARKAEA